MVTVDTVESVDMIVMLGCTSIVLVDVSWVWLKLVPLELECVDILDRVVAGAVSFNVDFVV